MYLNVFFLLSPVISDRTELFTLIVLLLV